MFGYYSLPFSTFLCAWKFHNEKLYPPKSAMLIVNHRPRMKLMCVVRSGEDRSGSGRLGLRGGHLEASEVKQNLTMTLIQRGGLQLRPQPHSSASVFYLLPLLTVPVLLLLFWGSGVSEWRIFQEIQRVSQISSLSSNSQSWGCLLWKPEHTGSWGMIYENAGTGRPSVPWS